MLNIKLVTMYSSFKPTFKHVSIYKIGEYLKVYISKTVLSDNINFSIGKESDETFDKCYRICKELDDYIGKILIAGEKEIEKEEIKKIVKKHKQRNHLRLITNDKSNLEKQEIITIKTLWDSYVKYHNKLGEWSEVYKLTHIQTVTNLINRPNFPQTIDKPSLVIEWLLDGKRTPKTAKDRFKLIVAAIDWCSKNDVCDRLLGLKYRDCLSSSFSQINKASEKSNNDVESEINPFTLEEIKLILDALQSDKYSRFKGKHSQYFNYVKFLWITGCRPSEAISLKWHNVDIKKKRITFCEGIVIASGKTISKKGTKTQPLRKFPMNEDLIELFSSMPKDSEFVFTVDGKPINQHTFLGVWKRLLEKIGIPYRIPYQLRHSMISYHVNRGFPIIQLASIVGNSPEVIQKHYLKLDLSLINVPRIE